MTDPQTAADAAERVQAFLDAWDTTEYLAEMTEVAGPFDGVPALTTYDLRALLEDRTRTAAELEQVRGDWLTQAAQLNRIAGMVGHALILRACDDATPEEVRLALARACEDVQGVIGESEATRAQRTERYLVMCANLLNDHVLRERDVAVERAEHATDLLAALTAPDCHRDSRGQCASVMHADLGEFGSDCSHALARAFLAGAKAHRSTGVTASAAPDATGDTQTGERRADGLRDLTKLEGAQRGSQGDAVELAP